jgi:ribosomal protein S21
MSTTLSVENLPFSVTADAVRRLFSPYGSVEAVRLMSDRSRGVGFVTMTSGGAEAIAALHQTDLQGRRLSVHHAKPREARPPGRPAGHAVLAIAVQHNDIEFALRLLKRQVQKAGLIRELRRRRQYEKPSERRRRQQRAGIKNTRKRELLLRG